MYGIAEYFCTVFWLALRARQITVQLLEVLSDATHQNV